MQSRNIFLLQLIVEDCKILCPFFQVSLKKYITIQAIESAKPPEKYAFADSTVPLALNNKK